MIPNKKIKYYFTLQEVVEVLSGDVTIQPFSGGEVLYTIFHNRIPHADCFSGQHCKEYMEDVFNRVYARYFSHYAIVTDHENLNFIDKDEFAYKLYTIFDRTYDKYSELLKYYASAKTHLMDKINSTTDTTSKFTDTPQEGDEDYDDPYLTNKTTGHSESNIEPNTMIMRLSEISRNFDTVMARWCDEFDKLFIEEANVQ